MAPNDKGLAFDEVMNLHVVSECPKRLPAKEGLRFKTLLSSGDITCPNLAWKGIKSGDWDGGSALFVPNG